MSQTEHYSYCIKARYAPLMTTPWYRFAHRFNGLWIDGQRATYPVVNERAVRATAGLTFVAAGTAFFLAFFLGNYTPLKMVTLLATTDFALRLLTGMTPLSPLGLIGTWLVRRQRPEWVGAAQKRFAWTLGLIISAIVAFLVNTGRTGTLSASLCIICLTLMWMETALGLCIGCKIYHWLTHSGVIRQPEVQPACPGGLCAIPQVRSDDKHCEASGPSAARLILNRKRLTSRSLEAGKNPVTQARWSAEPGAAFREDCPGSHHPLSLCEKISRGVSARRTRETATCARKIDHRVATRGR